MLSITETKQVVSAAQRAFGVTPDPRFLFLSRTHRETVVALDQGIQRNRGFFVVLGAPGTGKTTILYRLIEKYRTLAATGFVFQTQGTSGDLLRHIAADLGVAPSNDSTELANRIRDFLIATHSRGRTTLLVVDEAQNLSAEALEMVRLLSNYETSHSKLLQIILAGQEQLANRLLAPELLQLAQRITLVRRLLPLSKSEVSDYIQHRLSVVGAPPQLFGPSAIVAIALSSEGIPRNVNRLCYTALCLAEAEGCGLIDAELILRAESDTFSELLSISDSASKACRVIRASRPDAPKGSPVPAVESPTPAKIPAWPMPTAQHTEQARIPRSLLPATAGPASLELPKIPAAASAPPKQRSSAAVELRFEKQQPSPMQRYETGPAVRLAATLSKPILHTTSGVGSKFPVVPDVAPRFRPVSVDEGSTRKWAFAGVVLALILGITLIITIPTRTSRSASVSGPRVSEARP